MKMGQPLSEKRESNQERMKRNLYAIMEDRYEDVDADIIGGKQLKKYQYGAAALKRARRPVPTVLDGVLDNVWVWGPAGSGKDVFVRSEIGDRPHFRMLNSWSGYNDEEDVIISEYSGGKPRNVKMWCDRYPFQAGRILIRPKRMWVTSNYHPDKFFKGQDGASIRRHLQIIHIANGVAEYEEREADVKPPPLVCVEKEGDIRAPPSPNK
jgi:hypothetical protein